MQRIGGAGNINGLFVAEDVSLSRPPTAITADWLNSMQEEVATVVEQAGLALDPGSNTQLYEAIAALIAAAAGSGGAPSGSYLWHAGSVAPAGYLVCDGSAVSRSAYPALFAAIGTVYGAGDGATTFNLPDPRGDTLRALDLGKGRDVGRELGTHQDGMIGGHSHSGTTQAAGSHTHSGTLNGDVVAAPEINVTRAVLRPDDAASTNLGTLKAVSVVISPAGSHSHTFDTNSVGGVETRMANTSALLCIKT